MICNKYNSSGQLIEQWEEINYSKKLCLESKHPINISYGPTDIYITCSIHPNDPYSFPLNYNSFHDMDKENEAWDKLAVWIESNT